MLMEKKLLKKLQQQWLKWVSEYHGDYGGKGPIINVEIGKDNFMYFVNNILF